MEYLLTKPLPFSHARNAPPLPNKSCRISPLGFATLSYSLRIDHDLIVPTAATTGQYLRGECGIRLVPQPSQQ